MVGLAGAARAAEGEALDAEGGAVKSASLLDVADMFTFAEGDRYAIAVLRQPFLRYAVVETALVDGKVVIPREPKVVAEGPDIRAMDAAAFLLLGGAERLLEDR